MPAQNIFETSLRRGKFDESRKLANGGMLDFTHVYPMDAVFDTPEDVPEEVRVVAWGPGGGGEGGGLLTVRRGLAVTVLSAAAAAAVGSCIHARAT